MLELNISTILLQMANFFILVFILYRFLFKPVQNVLKKREKEITRSMDEAKIAQEAAEETKKRFEEKTNNFEAEVTARTNEARIVIERTRKQMLQEVQTKVEHLKAQTEESLSQMQTKAVQHHKEKLGDLASSFAKGMMNDIMTTIFKVKPTIGTKMNAISMDSGMATPTKSALVLPIKNIRTSTTTRNPRMIELNRLLTLFRVWVLVSPVMVTIRLSGAVC